MAIIYAILLIITFLDTKFSEIVRLDSIEDAEDYTKDYLEKYGFFTYLYLGGSAYIAYLLARVVKKTHPLVSENHKVCQS